MLIGIFCGKDKKVVKLVEKVAAWGGNGLFCSVAFCVVVKMVVGIGRRDYINYLRFFGWELR